MFSTREDRSDGLDLRTVRYGPEEVCSRLYFAVRDRWWRTAPLSIVRSRRGVTGTGFVHEIDAVTGWDSHPVEVALRYVADGAELTAEVTATARGSFTYGRIGWCVLFPMGAYSGRPAVSWRAGVATEFGFPTEVVTRDLRTPASTRFHRPFDVVDTTLAPGTRVRFSFQGAEFELEDQRNWTDASYKAYSIPPPGAHRPLSTVDGQRFTQRVRIRVEPAGLPDGARDPAVSVGAPVAVVPSIGLFDGRLSPRSFRPGGGFHDLNARPLGPADLATHDSIELPVNGAVHAADDDSVLETTAMHGILVAQIRATYPDVPVRLAPVSFRDVAGDWLDRADRYAPEPPDGPLSDRLLSGFAATWVIASAARALPEGPDMLRYFDAAMPPDTPAARAVARLHALRGRPVLTVRALEPLAALAVGTDHGITLAVANTGPDPIRFRLPDGRDGALDAFASAWFDLSHVPRPTTRTAR
ncbi:hypothetical protein [Virgisporangium aurantiacum]|uniref:Uncharacterized protein n=1 Tax=Virgisporangium aurantiacum TaxID=175570 RepID=A0A8J3Z2S8_9ACTN|nr:hypothetical protein [Virgisporangium aurantiacum]GIJ54186.1 hypothetical protein Vau01_017020 [Virgisporangium aurantiacum]